MVSDGDERKVQAVSLLRRGAHLCPYHVAAGFVEHCSSSVRSGRSSVRSVRVGPSYAFDIDRELSQH